MLHGLLLSVCLPYWHKLWQTAFPYCFSLRSKYFRWVEYLNNLDNYVGNYLINLTFSHHCQIEKTLKFLLICYYILGSFQRVSNFFVAEKFDLLEIFTHFVRCCNDSRDFFWSKRKPESGFPHPINRCTFPFTHLTGCALQRFFLLCFVLIGYLCCELSCGISQSALWLRTLYMSNILVERGAKTSDFVLGHVLCLRLRLNIVMIADVGARSSKRTSTDFPKSPFTFAYYLYLLLGKTRRCNIVKFILWSSTYLTLTRWFLFPLNCFWWHSGV